MPTEPGGAAKLHYVDAIRGWAILLVITSHVGGMFAEMPYPVKKLTNFGVHGVQMFFLASAVTLLMSWHRQKGADKNFIQSFFIRRFLRIAPMYYIGALIYFLVEPPNTGFDPLQFLRAFTFVNAWHPDWVATTQHWTVVPGGWSIGVEFTFYFVFPLAATLVTSMPRALGLLAMALAGAIIGNHFGAIWLRDEDPVAARNFLYFWFPNQAPVFALGMVLYFLVAGLRVRITSVSLAYGLLALILAVAVMATERNGPPQLFGLHGVPTIAIATLAFMAFFLVRAKGRETWFTHPLVRRMGVLSFSAYVLHFLFVHQIPGWTGGLIDVRATGFTAIAMGAGLWVLTLPCTFAAATLAHRWIEQPGIDLAHRLTSARRLARASS